MSAARNVTPADASYAQLVEPIRQQIEEWRREGKRIGVSSSFQTHSIPLLHILSTVGPVPVYFLDTGYHFAETLRYRDEIVELLEAELIVVRSSVTKLHQRASGGMMLFATDPDYCCELNKTLPMDDAVADLDVWISGVRRDQNDHRADFEPIMRTADGTIRYHPMLTWTTRMVWEYSRDHELPRHPLDDDGYASIGCAPCTRRLDPGDDSRSGRWFGLAKTECGLHMDLLD